MNALDNLGRINLNFINKSDARRHVNRLCIATERPLIESGTAGYHGQVQVILRVTLFLIYLTPRVLPNVTNVILNQHQRHMPIALFDLILKSQFTALFGPKKNSGNALPNIILPLEPTLVTHNP
jgi:ubiquitin-like 1-activating enzyme E1 B